MQPRLAFLALLLCVALALALAAAAPGAARRAVLGGAALLGPALAPPGKRRGAVSKGAPPGRAPRPLPARPPPAPLRAVPSVAVRTAGRRPAQQLRQQAHGLGRALHGFARRLVQREAVGRHPLDREAFAPLEPAAGGGKKAPPAPKRPWTEYPTWDALRADAGALAAYFRARAAALNNPAFDWGGVTAALAPHLLESREYIGIVNVGADGRTLSIASMEASPIEAGTMESATNFAGVPSELVEKYGDRPGLFIFHTHPADARGSPLPSSNDLSTAIHFGAMARFAANVVVSRYGVLVYGPDWDAYKAINRAKDWRLALLNFSHDVVAAHESMRSWALWTLQDYFSFYPRHRLFFSFSPSPEMVGDIRRYQFGRDLESQIDHALIDEHSADIVDHLRRVEGEPSLRARPAGADVDPAALASREGLEGLVFDAGPGFAAGGGAGCEGCAPEADRFVRDAAVEGAEEAEEAAEEAAEAKEAAEEGA